MSVASRGEVSAELLQRAQMREPRACLAFVQLYQSRVHSVLHRMVAGQRGRHVVEDLAQETFLKAFQALPRFDRSGTAALSTWLLTIATRLAIDELRRPNLVLAMAEVPEVGEEPRGTDRELTRVLNGALQRLPVEQRDVFVLHVLEELPHAEIAWQLGCEVGTVKSRLSRARISIEQSLKEAGYGR